MRISDWSSDVCSSDLRRFGAQGEAQIAQPLVQRLRIFPQMRALVRPVHQLADAGGGGRDDAGRQRGGKDIGAADEPQNLELRMVGDAEAADGADALAKGPDNEIDVAEPALVRKRGV